MQKDISVDLEKEFSNQVNNPESINKILKLFDKEILNNLLVVEKLKDTVPQARLDKLKEY